MAKPYLYIVISFLCIKGYAQDLVPKKTNYAIVYLDSLMLPCKVNTASYYGYIPAQNYYLNSDPLVEKNLKHKLVYTPFSDTIFETSLKPLHGELPVYSNREVGQKFDHLYIFNLGTLTEVKEPSKKGFHMEISYLDSLKNGDQNTFARYTSEKNIPIYKQYLNKNGNKSFSEKIYIGEHKTFTSKYRPIVGLYWNLGPDEAMKRNSRTFLELGITKKYLKGAFVKAVNKNYYDNLQFFHSVNASLLATARAEQIYLGQKLTYSYTYMFFKGEAGVLNYTDLKKDDIRIMGGLGFSVLSRLSGMVYYSLPLTKNEFKDLGRIAIGFSFH